MYMVGVEFECTANEVKTKEKYKLPEIKNELQHKLYIHRNLASHQPRHHTGRRDANNHHSPPPPPLLIP